jgi:hypothetical protein
MFDLQYKVIESDSIEELEYKISKLTNIKQFVGGISANNGILYQAVLLIKPLK